MPQLAAQFQEQLLARLTSDSNFPNNSPEDDNEDDDEDPSEENVHYDTDDDDVTPKPSTGESPIERLVYALLAEQRGLPAAAPSRLDMADNKNLGLNSKATNGVLYSLRGSQANVAIRFNVHKEKREITIDQWQWHSVSPGP